MANFLTQRPTPQVLMIWVFGFFAWFAFDLFVEAHVFEWLQWNGTEKNDWFFVLWWGGVAVWLIYGGSVLAGRIKQAWLEMRHR